MDGAAAAAAGFSSCSITFFGSSFFSAGFAAGAFAAAETAAGFVLSSGLEGPQPMSDANFVNIDVDWFSSDEDEMLSLVCSFQLIDRCFRKRTLRRRSVSLLLLKV